MTKNIKQHEEEYIHISKEFMENIAIIIFILIVLGGTFSFGFAFGNSVGHNNGFEEGKEYQLTYMNENFLKVWDSTSCSGKIIYVTDTRNVTVYKQDCYLYFGDYGQLKINSGLTTSK